MGYVRFCLRYVEDCKVHGQDFRRRTVSLTDKRWAELIQINRQINRDITAQSDLIMGTQRLVGASPNGGLLRLCSHQAP